MANSVKYKDLIFTVGDTVGVNYRIKEGDKERLQLFAGIVTKIRGKDNESRMVTVRKMTRSGIGVERIFPLASPFISDIKVTKKSPYSRAKLYFIKNLSNQNLRRKLYKQK